MKNRAQKSFLAAVLLGVLLCSSAQSAPQRVLMVGNSYTYGHLLPWMIYQISQSLTPESPLFVEMVVKGGISLQMHKENGSTERLLIQKNWDAVVFQDHSLATLERRAGMIQDTRYFLGLAKKQGVTPYLYMTWARKYAPETQKTIAETYEEAAKGLAQVVPVGLARQRSIQQFPEIELYLEDQSHPSFEGAYLAACLFYTHLSGGKSPIGATRVIHYPRSTKQILEAIDHPKTLMFTSSFFSIPEIFESAPVQELSEAVAGRLQRVALEFSPSIN